MTMLEKVAQAIAEVDSRGGLYEDAARAALMVMREFESPVFAGLISLSMEEIVDAILREHEAAN